jgi:zinc protease
MNIHFRKAAPLFVAFVMAAAPAFAQTQAADVPQSYKQVPIPELHKFVPAKPVRVTLSNGIELFLEEDHELPFIDGFVRIRGGSRDEPADKVGLVSLYGETWRTSGTAKHPGDALDDELAAKAASIETSGSEASTSVHWSGFSRDFDGLLATSIDLLEHPAFSEEKLDLAKRNMAASLLRRNDDASGIAEREALEIAYGKTNPYARQPELATVGAVTLADLNAWHAKTVNGANIVVGVIGDFDVHAMEAKLRAAFESLPKGTEIPTPKVQFTEPTPSIYYVNKPDVNQSNIYMVGLGIEERNPDFYALAVMNQIFSGGFSSRVVQNVRTKLGLAYDVYGHFGSAYDHPGIFAVELGTRSAATVDAAKATLAEVARLRTDPPTPDELRGAKEELLNSFVFRYDTPEKVLAEQVTLAVYGYPADFLDRYREAIEKVTSADVSRVAQKYVEPGKLAIVVVGNMGEITPPLTGLGKTTQLDITIPGAPQAQ